ncbi:MAG TPA: S8 family serine peptidase [Solirubrobacterales bacterium]|nr:S8 family serine peptidase [Solirubrobacterales bacterium]
MLACSAAAALASVAPALGAGETPARPADAAATTPATTFATGQIIVVWEEGVSRGEKAAARDDAEVDSSASLGSSEFQLVETQPGQSTADALSELRSDPAVAIAERDALVYPALTPTDPLFNQLWALQNTGAEIDGVSSSVAGSDINATSAWDQFGSPFVGLPGAGAVVADIDSGYRFEGNELGSVVWTNPGEIPGNGKDDDEDGYVDDVHGYDFVGANADSPAEDADPTDDNSISGGHGVHTAGTIGAAGNNAEGITGVAMDARIMPLRVCANSTKSSPPNSLACPISSIISAINFAGAHAARVANISLTSKSASAATREALAKNPGTLYVISAGNDAKDNDIEAHYPCNYNPATETSVPGAIDNVVCVAATTQADQLAGFSDWGKNSVDLAAPGTEILSTYTFDDLLGVGGENFQAEDFNSKWSPGGDGGFGRTKEGVLTSFGMSDSPEEAPVANSVRESTLTTGVPVPAGYANCRFEGRRFVSLLGKGGKNGIFTQEIIKEGDPTPLFKSQPGNTAGAEMQAFRTEAISGMAGSNVKIRFRYEAKEAPEPTNGVWLDDLSLICYQPPSVAPGYAFLQGTSMAAPQVSGTAALLFSLHPNATVTGVRKALLAGVVARASLTNKTVSGGRLDANLALNALDATAPTPPSLSSTNPPSGTDVTEPLILGSAEGGSTVRLFKGGSCSGSPLQISTAAQLEAPGLKVTVPKDSVTEFTATATDSSLNVSECSAPITYTEKTPPPDTTPPAPPVLSATNPTSPGASATPRILGSAEANSIVRVYSNQLCTGTPTVTAGAEALQTLGIPVSVPSSSTATFWATATDAAGNPSECSAPISYTNSTLTGPITNDPPVNPPPTSSSCTVPKLAGKTLAQAKSAITRALCKLGKVTKPKAKPSQKLGPLVVKSSSPAAGAVAASGVVSLKLGPKPVARRAKQSRS